MEEARKRRRAQSNQSFPYIPEEIVFNILPNLPITSLLRLRCVSKQWCRLVTETKIQKRHKLLLLSREDFSGRVRELRYSCLSIGENPVLETLCRYHVDDSYWPDRLRLRWKSRSLSNPFFQFMGACNGLLLIRQNTDLYLCNPSLGWYRKVTSHHHIGCGLFTYSGLFFDPGDNSYKALVAFTDTCRCDHCRGDFYVWVACFKTSTWTRILFPYDRHTIESGPTLNNYVHWSASAVRISRGHRPRLPHRIIRFDHRTNVFVELPMPKPKKDVVDYLVGLGVLDGCLCTARSDGENLGFCGMADVEVLIMKEYGVKESWKSLFRVKNANCYNLVPFFYAESKDEVLMGIRQDDNVAIYVYNTKTDTFTIVKELEHFDHIIAYEETLVRPPEFLME